MVENIRMYLLVAFAVKSCSAVPPLTTTAQVAPTATPTPVVIPKYYNLSHGYRDLIRFEIEAQFPVSRGFDVALYSKSLANITGFAACSSPKRVILDFGRPDEYLFVSTCVSSEIENYILTTGKVDNLTAIDESSNKASINVIIRLNIANVSQFNTLMRKFSPEVFKNLMDPAAANTTRTEVLYGRFDGYRYYGVINVSETSQNTEENYPLTTSISLPTTTNLLTSTTTRLPPTPMPEAIPMPSGINDRQWWVVGTWLLVTIVVATSNLLFRTSNNYSLISPQTAPHSAAAAPPVIWARRTAPAAV